MSGLIHAVLEFFEGLGYWGIMLGLAVEIIPSELVLSYGGYLVHKGEIQFIGAVVFGTVGIMIAQMILYWIGRYGGRPFLDKYGKYLHIKSKHLDITERWFEQYGPGVVFAARFIPVFRQVVSIPAGIARMSSVSFMLYTLLATVPWCIGFIFVGMKLGENWESINEKARPYLLPIGILAIVLIALYVWLKLRRNKTTA